MLTTSLFTLCLAAIACALPTSDSDLSKAGPPADQVYIKDIVYGGSGCPGGSVGRYISDDRQTFTLIFDQFVASIGSGVPVTNNRKNCQLNIDLQYPQGFQYSILNTIYRGYVSIDAGVTARQEATYYFSGQSAQATCGIDFRGPVTKDYTQNANAPLSSIVWSPCGASQALNINSQVRLTGSGSGQITTDSQDGKIKFVVGLQWKTC